MGRCPTLGSPTPALPLRPVRPRVSSSYFCMSSRSLLRCPLQEDLWDFEAECGLLATLQAPLWVLIVLSSPLHTLQPLDFRVSSLLVSLLEAETMSEPLLCSGPA